MFYWDEDRYPIGGGEQPTRWGVVMLDDTYHLEVELITPVAMEKEVRFAIREGGRTVGAGVVTEILE